MAVDLFRLSAYHKGPRRDKNKLTRSAYFSSLRQERAAAGALKSPHFSARILDYRLFRRVFLDLSALCGYNGEATTEHTEVTSINKQKFLAELGKLLTFMYEEDRQRAIELYSRMFDESGDEMALLQSLVSPTRQAVIVARAYNSNLGRLSLTSESKAAPEDRDENGVPDYVHQFLKTANPIGISIAEDIKSP